MRIFIILIFIAGCATSSKINRISVGMTKQDVIKNLGPPVSVSAQNGLEYLNYRFSETSDHAFYGITTPYYVRIIKGRVESYGRTGDFDSTKTPTLRVESDQKIDATIRRSSAAEEESEQLNKLKELKKMKDDGIIEQAEYDSLKKKLIKEWAKSE